MYDFICQKPFILAITSVFLLNSCASSTKINKKAIPEITSGSKGGVLVAVESKGLGCSETVFTLSAVNGSGRYSGTYTPLWLSSYKTYRPALITVPAGQYKIVSAGCDVIGYGAQYTAKTRISFPLMMLSYETITVKSGSVTYPGTFKVVNAVTKAEKKKGVSRLEYSLENNDTLVKAEFDRNYPSLSSRYETLLTSDKKADLDSLFK